MNLSNALEIAGGTIIVGIVITWLIYYKDKPMAIAHGFYDDVNKYLDAIDETDDLIRLKGYENSLNIFREGYRKDIKERVLNDACGKIEAAIKNRRIVIQNTIHFLTEA